MDAQRVLDALVYGDVMHFIVTVVAVDDGPDRELARHTIGELLAGGRPQERLVAKAAAPIARKMVGRRLFIHVPAFWRDT